MEGRVRDTRVKAKFGTREDSKGNTKLMHVGFYTTKTRSTSHQHQCQYNMTKGT